MLRFVAILICLSLSEISTAPAESTTLAWIVQTDATPTESPSTTTTQPELPLAKPEMYYMKIHSDVASRYATTLITSNIANPATKSQEVTFSVVLPETAFISEFLMIIDGKVYKSNVKEKDEAKKIFDDAVQSGLSAGHVAVSARDSNRFTVSVNIEPEKKATFNLTYEELLSRRLGVYNLDINIHTDEIVRELEANVYIKELIPITVLRTPALRTGNEIDADENAERNELATTQFNENKTEATIRFVPNADQQKQLIEKIGKKDKSKSGGLSGQFVVQYDVDRDSSGGEVLVHDGYFVHFFAPTALKPLNKHVIFVLDVSGSMLGRKMQQLKEAMNLIVDDLKPGDYMNLVQFNYNVKVWNLNDPEKSLVYRARNSWYDDDDDIKSETTASFGVVSEPFPVNDKTKTKAREVVKLLHADGGTNIYDALAVALNISNAAVKFNKNAAKNNRTALPEPIVILLTDGEATVGETSATKTIQMAVRNNIGAKPAAIYTLSFGDDADRDFLERLALNNRGFLRNIYEASDAADQLHSFYRAISSPLLSNVTYKIAPEQAQNVTETAFPTLFNGSELVVSGKVINDMPIDIVIRGDGSEGIKSYRPAVVTIPKRKHATRNSLERLWAYMTIKKLLENKEVMIEAEHGAVMEEATVSPIAKSDETDEAKRKRALTLALKYSFVTKVTSLVVVKPDQSAVVDTVKADTRASENDWGSALPLNGHIAFTSKSRIVGGFAPPASAFSAPAPAFPYGLTQTSVQLSNIAYSSHTLKLDSPVIGWGQYEDEAEIGMVYATTTLPLQTTTKRFDFLQSVYVNDTAILLNGTTYLLEKDGNVAVGFDTCTTPQGSIKMCTLLAECSSMTAKIVNLAEYLKYFCSAQSYAGICCDVETATIV